MHGAGNGLTKVKTTDLVKTLRLVVRGDLPTPVDVLGLARTGLQHTSEPLLDALRGLDDRAVRSLLVCVIAERADR
tara:strand:- start:132 stop:359 length:228 start_codon:yes stop_codon:yes gene_type:complete